MFKVLLCLYCQLKKSPILLNCLPADELRRQHVRVLPQDGPAQPQGVRDQLDRPLVLLVVYVSARVFEIGEDSLEQTSYF